MFLRWVLFFVFLILGFIIKPEPPHVRLSEPAEALAVAQHEMAQPELEKPAEPTKKKPEPVLSEAEQRAKLIKENPNNCDQDTHYIVFPDGRCSEIPKASETTSAPATVKSVGSGSCQAEIAKYDWNQSVATAVMLAESGGRTWIVNDDPSTGDYSVGCFQVNLYGENALNRPSEAQLKIASVNVKWAYNNYVANGHSFIGQWGVCRSKVACY